MNFTMRMPFYVHAGAREDGYYTATVLDQHGRYVDFDGCKSRSVTSQDTANMLAMRKARVWAQRVRTHAGL